jgi:hypothetical protein
MIDRKKEYVSHGSTWRSADVGGGQHFLDVACSEGFESGSFWLE